jgi:glycosyltransferase involved in cell wall biosynthesis
MNILQITPYFYPAWSYGGIPRVVYELSKALVKKGHDVTVCTTDVFNQNSRCDQSGKEAVVDGIKVHYFKNLSNTLAYNYQVFLPIGLGSFIQRTISEFDIIHLHGHRHLLNNIVHHYAIKNKKPYVFSGHGTILRIERRVRAKVIFDMVFGQKILRDAAHFVAVSENEVKQYGKMGVDKKRVTVIYNGIDVNDYEVLPQKNNFRKKYNLIDKKIVLYLGKITPRKGLDFLVKAFSELIMDDAMLVIAGNDMGFKSRVETIIKERSLDNKVIFTGLLVGEEKLSAYQDADVLVYPAIYEIFGLVPFESIMCGTPVIITDDCGCGDIIGKIGAGYIVKYGDVQGLKDKILEVLKNKKEAQEKVQKGKEFIQQNLRWEKIAYEMGKVYEQICS